MDVHDRMLSLAGRDVLFRPIEFERYRKPHVVEYPRHATVLNPHHARLQHQQQQQQLVGRSARGGENGAAVSSSDSEGDDGDDSDRKAKRRRRGGGGADTDSNDSDDDDNPQYMSHSDFLCSDAALEKVLHLRWREIGPVGIGLVNLGNTCFANSVIQAFSYTPALAQFFAETYRAADTQLGAPYDFAFALGETIRQVHLGRNGSGRGGPAPGGGRGSQHHHGGGAYRPGLILGHLRTLSKHFSLGKQSDAHEFAVQLLYACQRSILHRLVGSKKLPLRVSHTTALSRICGGYLRSQVSWSRQDEIQQLLKVGKRQEAADLKMEQRNRGGSRNADRMTSNTYDPTNILHVELTGQTLEHCLAKFCGVEKLHGRCYLSPRDVAVVATKQLKVHIPPNVLIVHLKRFSPTGGKVSRYVQYPLRLDLHPYTTDYEGEERRRGEQEGSRENTEHPQHLYELNAICVHEGSSISYGHYYAVVRARNGTWYECNDASVIPISAEKALRQQAYMLFYSRIPVDRKKSQPRKQSTGANGSASFPAAKVAFTGPHGHFSSSPALTANARELLGEELTEEQVAAALLAARKKQSSKLSIVPSTAPGIEDEAQEANEKEPAAKTAQRKNKFASHVDDMRLSFKRQREVLSTDEDEDEDEDEGGERQPVADQGDNALAEEATTTVPESERRRGATTEGVARGDEEQEPAKKSLRNAVYGSVVKAMRVNPATPLQRALKSRQSTVLEPRQQGETRALGRAAVIALDEKKQLSMPATVKRDGAAPMFQQPIRDAMWEIEMDKGRVKKVRRKPIDSDEEGGKLNRFQQKSANRFDSRGRRLQE